MYGGNPVSWFSRKQTCVALSTAEAEYLSSAASIQELVYLIGIRSEFQLKGNNETILCIDNQSAIFMIKSFENSKRTKHIDIKEHFIKDLFYKGIFSIEYVCSEENIADIMTKAR